MWRNLSDTARLAAWRGIIIIICSYGLLYYAYKFGTPNAGGNDFFRYYGMYLSPLDLSAAEAPWIYRQLNAVIVHAISLTGLRYDTGIAFESEAYSKDIWFAALVSNYLALAGCALLVTFLCDSIIGRREDGGIYSLSAGLLCFLSFSTLPHVLTGLAEGWAWFLSAFVALSYVKRWSLGVVAALALAIVQRETIPLLFVILSALAFIGRWRRYDLFVLCAAGAASIGYYVMRMFVVPVSGGEEQLQVDSWIGQLAQFRLTGDILMQGILSQNILALMLLIWGILGWTDRPGPSIPRFLTLPHILIAVAGLIVVGLAVGIGNNIGRILGILVPLECALTGAMLHALSRTGSAHKSNRRGNARAQEGNLMIDRSAIIR